ncbi:MAG: TMEM43 family protein [Dehalococcoidia bacterium]|nr:TMEM43 family protein [Dehalococcoidia bacterium]
MTNKSILPVFWALIGAFVLLFISLNVMNSPIRTLLNDLYPDEIVAVAVSTFFQFSGLLFFALGLTLLILTARAKLDKIFKSFLLLTGSSAVGVFVSILLHGVVYGLFILLFGGDFWDRTGIADEPFFFIMAIFICPLAYLVGTVGSIVLIIRRGKHETRTV